MAEKKRTPTFSENLSLLNERLESVSPQKLLEISYGPTGFLDFQKSCGEKLQLTMSDDYKTLLSI